MEKMKRVLALSAAIALLVVMVFSTAYIVHEADHDCIGDGCSICYHINVCISALKTFFHAIIAVAIAAALISISCFRPVTSLAHAQNVTLVALKVKLSI